MPEIASAKRGIGVSKPSGVTPGSRSETAFPDKGMANQAEGAHAGWMQQASATLSPSVGRV